MKYRVIDISASISFKRLTHRMPFPQFLAAEPVIIRYAIREKLPPQPYVIRIKITSELSWQQNDAISYFTCNNNNNNKIFI